MSQPFVNEHVAYLDLEPDDLALLAELRPLLEKHADGLVAAFYRHLLSFGPTRELLRDPDVKERLLQKQREYLLSLAGPRIDDDYLAERRRIGEVHHRVGLEPRWYLGAYTLYFSLLTPLVCESAGQDMERGHRMLTSLQKLLSLDAELALETYIDHQQRELEYLTRELAVEGRRLEKDYRDQTAELRRTTDRARAAEELASLATLVAGLAHEIGTPMGVIQGHAKMLEGAVTGEDAPWRLRTIQEQIGRISRIIQTLLNIARPGAMRRVPVALEPLVENTVSFLREKLGRRGIELDLAFDTAARVRGDPERLQQLLLNLFLNAADAMPEGGRLRVCVADAPDEEVEVRVADTGVGIPEHDLPRVFEPFFTSKQAGEGNGLGLMVAKGIVADHGGSIEVSSRVGDGTEFRILLPADAAASASA